MGDSVRGGGLVSLVPVLRKGGDSLLMVDGFIILCLFVRTLEDLVFLEVVEVLEVVLIHILDVHLDAAVAV